MKKIFSSLRNNVITGILVLAPIGAVLWLLIWVWGLLMDLTSLIPSILRTNEPGGFEKFLLSFVVLALLILFVWGVGLISRNYIGRKLLSWISKVLNRVPVISTIYSTLEQLLKTFATGQAKNFRRVVQIEYPRKGLYTLAFVTGERDQMVHIYVPTTPNPTSGFYLTTPKTEIKDVDKTVEEALKEIISMGIVQK